MFVAIELIPISPPHILQRGGQQLLLHDALAEIVPALTDLAAVLVVPYIGTADATAAALSSRVRFVSGDLEHGPRGFRIEPLAIASDRLVVPDLAGDTSAPAVAPGTLATPRDPIVAALTRAEAALEELCHAGLAARTRAALDELVPLCAARGIPIMAAAVRQAREEVWLKANGAAIAEHGAWLDRVGMPLEPAWLE